MCDDDWSYVMTHHIAASVIYGFFCQFVVITLATEVILCSSLEYAVGRNSSAGIPFFLTSLFFSVFLQLNRNVGSFHIALHWFKRRDIPGKLEMRAAAFAHNFLSLIGTAGLLYGKSYTHR